MCLSKAYDPGEDPNRLWDCMIVTEIPMTDFCVRCTLTILILLVINLNILFLSR